VVDDCNPGYLEVEAGRVVVQSLVGETLSHQADPSW
jgi:hypothetical protein